MSLIAWGYSNKEAADKLKVSVKTVETYRVRIAEKLGLRSRTQLVKYALRQGWLNDAEASRPAGALTRAFPGAARPQLKSLFSRHTGVRC